MSTITDDDLTRLLDEAASSYDVPERGPDEVLAALADVPPRVPVVRRRWVQLSAAAAVVTVGVIAIGAQSGGGPSTTTTALDKATSDGSFVRSPNGNIARQAAPLPAGADSAGGAAGKVVGGAAGLPGTAGGAGTTTSTGSTFTSNGGAALAPAAPAAAGQKSAVTAPKVDAPATDDGAARVVKSGSIALVVKDNRVSPTLSAVQDAAATEGGYIAASSSDEYGDTPSGEVTIRVPVTHFEKLVARVRALDAKVRTASTSGKDVTAQYTDMQAQLRTLNATRDRFLVILSRTKTISEILTVQQRVDDVSGQIDRIEGQRKLLASQSDLSTLTVSVSEAGDPVVKATSKPRSGLSQAFQDAKDGFVNGVESIIRHSGGFLLFVLCLALVLAIGRGGWRLARRRMV